MDRRLSTLTPGTPESTVATGRPNGASPRCPPPTRESTQHRACIDRARPPWQHGNQPDGRPLLNSTLKPGNAAAKRRRESPVAAEVHRRKPPPKRGANRAGNPPAPPARASSPQGCQRTAPPGPRPSGDQPPTLDTSEYPPLPAHVPPMSRRPSGNKPKATGTPSGTRTASLTGGNQPRTFKSRQTALSIIPQPREPTRTIVNRAGGRFPNPAPAGINPIRNETKSN